MAAQTDTTQALTAVLSNHLGVAATYMHVAKEVRPGEPVSQLHSVLKWYEVSDPGTPVRDDIRAVARATIEDGRIHIDGLGFVVLNRCGNDFHFLLTATWRNNNELWETLWYKDGDRMGEFEEFPRPGPHKVALCVWELAPVWHERQSWVRFLLSKRDLAAAEQWLGDLFSKEG